MAHAARFNDAQVMFTLAMLSYEGTQNPNIGRLNDYLLRIALDESLAKLTPLQGEWEMAWGPVSYSAPFTLFADSAAFVARDRNRPSRLAVVIRGTNPFSAFDWVFGDVWVDRTVPWRYGDRSRSPGAALSLSSALGLSIIENMRWFEPPGFGLDEVADFVRDRVLVPAQWMTNQVVLPARARVRGVIDRARGALVHDLAKLRSAHASLEADVEPRLEGFLKAHESPAARRARDRFDRHFHRAAGALQVDLLHVMEGIERFESMLTPGEGILHFLRQEARAAEESGGDPLDVFVTGHSKGGALAPVVAQWLSDERRTRSGGWNRALDARVHCYAYAGPTPGNRAFARLVDRTLGTRGHRFSNRHDLVPHAWAVPSEHFEPHLDMEQVPELLRTELDASPKTIQLLKEVNDHLISSVAPLDYAHTLERARVFEGKPVEGSKSFLIQVLHQHTIAYAEELDLMSHLDLSDLFAQA